MDFQSSHPLDNITRNNPYSMLEALIPFVDYPMKLPLALLVKYYEVRLILNVFRSNDLIAGYGLHTPSNDPMDMLGNLLGVSPEMIRTLMTMMESGNSTDFNKQDQSTDNNNNSSEYDFDNNINNIFAEYDLLQAAEYNSQIHDESYQQTDNNRTYDNSENSQTLQEPEYYI